MKRAKKLSLAVTGVVIAMGLSLTPNALATTISTQFNTTDGFTTGDFNPVTLTNGSFQTTFSGGQQQQMFDLKSYNVNPAAYLFINGTFTGDNPANTASGDGVNDDTGLIDFNIGATTVSFYAANRGNGPGVTLNIFGTDDSTLLGTVSITQTSNQASDAAVLTTITSAGVGGLIGSIGINLPGPAGNPPYVLAIDTFSATAVPEPTTATAMLLGLMGLRMATRRTAA